MNSLVFRPIERQAQRMREMIERLDVDTLKLACLRNGDAYVEARVKCLDCGNTGQCFQWLDTPSPDVESPVFCPNVSVFEDCKRER